MSASQYRNDTQCCSALVRTKSESDNDAVLPSVWGSLRQCAKRKREFFVHPVAGSIPGGVTEIFIAINSSDRTMALGSTQPLTEMSTGSTSWG
jgi:hypothetical protein